MVATTSIGVRDLKAHAPTLVRRAAGGERIVITRYGRPEAVLGPVTNTGDARAAGARTARWAAERSAFERLLPSLLRKCSGWWVVVFGGKVVDSSRKPDVLRRRAAKRFRGGVFFLGRVSAELPVVDMPGFEVG